MGSPISPPNPSGGSPSGVPGMGGNSGSSDPTAALAGSWAANQMNSGAPRPDDDKYKKEQGSTGAFGSNPFGGGDSGGGSMP